MKKAIRYFLCIGCLLWFLGCERESLSPYSGANYIQFVKNLSVDSATVLFPMLMSTPEGVTCDSNIIVSLAMLCDKETEYKISVDTKFTDAVEGTHFRLPERTAFAAGATKDTISIRFLRTEEMKNRSYRLVLRVENNEHFSVGQAQYQYYVFRITDQVSQPTWWNTTMINYYLGAYSEKKHRLLIYFGKPNTLDQNGSITAASRLKVYLQQQKNVGNTVYEEDGVTEMTVGMYA